MSSTLMTLREEIDSERKEKREEQERDDRLRKEEADRQIQRDECASASLLSRRSVWSF